MTSRKQLVAYPEPCLAASNEAEEHFFENVDAVQTIITQENGFFSQDQRCMLVLSAILIGAPVDHGHQPILLSLSNLYADTKQLKNGMDSNNNEESTTEESQAIDLRLDSKIAESWSSKVNEGIQNTKQLKNGMDNNNQAVTTEESQASNLRLDSKIAESCSFNLLEIQSEGSQNAAANQGFYPVVPVVSRSVHLRCARKSFFLCIKRLHLLMLAVIFEMLFLLLSFTT